MKIICSYCLIEIGEKEPLSNDAVSHGMCKSCYANFREQIRGVPLGKYLDRFEAPVLIVNQDRRMVAANKMATVMTGKPEKDLVGLLGGEVMECARARLPEGCGHTVHCVACGIRNAVTATMETGEPQVRVPVQLVQENRKLQMVLSTEKIGTLICIIVESFLAKYVPPALATG